MRKPVIVLLVTAALTLGLMQGPGAASSGVPVGGSVTFTPADDTLLEIAGRGPYRGALEVRASGGRLDVINTLDLESYIMGIAEVPGSWPIEALKAQAVAARTYVLWERDNDLWTRQGFDVCATVACQVYRGAQGEQGEHGRRWVEAVRATEGQVLLHGGRPILARYHASSGGSTLANETVYPSSGSRPYLRAVDDSPDAEASPLHTWEVRFERDVLQQVLRAAIGVSGDLISVTNDQDTRTAVVRTTAGQRSMVTPTLRRTISAEAPKLFGSLYPGRRPDGLRMPETLPSSRFDVVMDGDTFVFVGRGFGHGVGMSQWGAKGRADRGDDYREILAAYYPGAELGSRPGPETIRVGLMQRVSSVGVLGDGAFGVAAGDSTLAESTMGRWTADASSGRSMRVTPPHGFDLPLVLSGVEVPEHMVVDPSVDVVPGVTVRFVVPKSARVDAELRGADGVVAGGGSVFDAGDGVLQLVIQDPGSLARSGTYEVALTAFDGTGHAHAVAQLDIERLGGGRGWLWTALGALMIAGAAAGGLRVRKLRRPRRPHPGDVDLEITSVSPARDIEEPSTQSRPGRR